LGTALWVQTLSLRPYSPLQLTAGVDWRNPAAPSHTWRRVARNLSAKTRAPSRVARENRARNRQSQLSLLANCGRDSMPLNRRKFLTNSSAALAASGVAFPTFGSQLGKNWNAQWIWYPGQLAAYLHSRRIRLAMTRCAYVGYPANFRQPVSET